MMPIKLCQGKCLISVKYTSQVALLISEKGKMIQVYNIKVVILKIL